MDHDGQLDSPEVREAINANLKDILAHGGWGKDTWDLVVERLGTDFGIETDLFELTQNAICLVRMFQAGALIHNGIIQKQTGKTVTEIIDSLLAIALRADKGDEKASNQLKVLHKVAHPVSYELPATIIKNLADSYHTSPHLARAWDVRALMLDLSYIVEPTNFQKSVLEGPVRLAAHRSPAINPELHAAAERHIKTGTTLQSLAIAIYLEELDKEGISLDPNQIRHDIGKLKEWESVNLKDAASYHWLPLWEELGRYPGASIPPIPLYSNGWKRLWRRDKKPK